MCCRNMSCNDSHDSEQQNEDFLMWKECEIMLLFLSILGQDAKKNPGVSIGTEGRDPR